MSALQRSGFLLRCFAQAKNQRVAANFHTSIKAHAAKKEPEVKKPTARARATVSASTGGTSAATPPPAPQPAAPEPNKPAGDKYMAEELFQYDKYSWYTINKDIEKLGKRQTQPEPQTPQ